MTVSKEVPISKSGPTYSWITADGSNDQHVPTARFRWLEKSCGSGDYSGHWSRVLQQAFIEQFSGKIEWRDVPVVRE